MKKFACSFILSCIIITCARAQQDTIGMSGKDSAFAPHSKVLYGIASFYSANLDGTKTATGEIFRHSKLTAASNHFKLHTWVRITNVRNGKSVIVRINDRMHKRMAAKGRVVDLSHSAAKILGFLTKGITRVKVEEVPKQELNEKNVNY